MSTCIVAFSVYVATAFMSLGVWAFHGSEAYAGYISMRWETVSTLVHG
jgi:hypothetical protein